MHKLAKYLLDVLGPIQSEDLELDRRHVLYRDDRQVKLLYVHLHSPSGGYPGNDGGMTDIVARPLRDVVADLALVHPLEDESQNRYLDSDGSPFYEPEIPDTDFPSTFDLRHAVGGEVTSHGALAASNQAELQEVLLCRNDALLASALSGAPFGLSGAHEPSRLYASDSRFAQAYTLFDEVATNYRNMLLSALIATPMPGLPRNSGEGQSFKAAVRVALEDLFAQRPVFSPIRVALKVIFIVVPPCNHKKDLDNIALAVLPVVDDILRPPRIAAYEVIELKRSKDDPPNGYLRLALGSGSQIGSTWQRVTDYVELLLERAAE
jgi:hypothetical protein